MNIQFLLKELDKLSLSPNDYVIVSSGSLAIRNIREANDLDILVTENLWNTLSKKYPLVKEFGIEKLKPLKDIEIVGQGSTFRNDFIATLKEIFETADKINGRNYINLVLLKKFKQKMGRDKDLKDIELINNYLSNS